MGIHKYKHNWSFFETPSQELYYFLGFVAADGYISENEIEIGINKKDIHILETFRDLICPDKPIYNKQKTDSYTLKISCKKYIPKFKKFFGMESNNKCYEVRFPQIPDEFYKDFIRGYIDGDGTIDLTKGYKANNVYIGPRLRILGNKHFLCSLNEKTKEFVKHNTNAISPKGKENIFYITYNFSTAKSILTWLYKDCSISLNRKKERAYEVANIS